MRYRTYAPDLVNADNEGILEKLANLSQKVLHALGIEAQDSTEAEENEAFPDHELPKREKNACTKERS